MHIPFNKPYMTGKEAEYITQAVKSGKISGNGEFTKKCQNFFEQRYGFKKCLLTTSCTDALEMAAILTGVGPGDEVIVPSYTFVSSALAFVRTGATIVFCDSYKEQPNIDPAEIEKLITPRTKVIVPVHYAGVACDMDAIMALAEKHGLLVVEDAAQAIDSFYESKRGSSSLEFESKSGIFNLHSSTSTFDFGSQSIPNCNSSNQTIKQSNNQTISRRPLGSIGHLACFSFHETKNIISGEGGMLVINAERFIRRAEIIWEKGTNRAEFFRGEVNKYGWVDTGSSFLPSEIVAAFLWAQLEHLDQIQDCRKAIWNLYYEGLKPLADAGKFTLPLVPEYATNNAHMFYLVFPDLAKRTDFIAKMKAQDILCVFHYLPLHSSEYFVKHGGALGDRALPVGGESGALGDHALPVGNESGALGDRALPVGNESGALGDRALPVGGESGALGDRALPVGNESGALGDRALPNCDRFADCLVRLPMYYELTDGQIDFVIKQIAN